MPIHFFQRASFWAVKFTALNFAPLSGQTNFVPTTPPVPIVEAKSSPCSSQSLPCRVIAESSTWSPYTAASGPSRALYTLVRERTCLAPTGSAVTAWSMYGSQANDGGVPHGQACVTLSGFNARVVWKIVLYTSATTYNESCG